MKQQAEKKSSMQGMKRQNRIFLVCMMTIPIIHWFIFWLYANLQSFTLAFQRPTGEWTVDNFRTFFNTMSLPGNVFTEAFLNTMMWFAFHNVLVFPFTLVLNYFFFKKMPGYKMWRIGLYIPALLSQVIVSKLISDLVLPSGALGVLIEKITGDKVPLFFADPRYANIAMIIYGFWGSWGANMLIFGGTFARIPEEVLEAAKLDGCSPARELVQLIIPMISPTLITMFILNLTGVFNASGPIILFTQGKYGTMTLAYWIFDSTRFGGAYNTVSAVGLCMTAVAVPVILTIRHFLEKIPVVEI